MERQIQKIKLPTCSKCIKLWKDYLHQKKYRLQKELITNRLLFLKTLKKQNKRHRKFVHTNMKFSIAKESFTDTEYLNKNKNRSLLSGFFYYEKYKSDSAFRLLFNPFKTFPPAVMYLVSNQFLISDLGALLFINLNSVSDPPVL